MSFTVQLLSKEKCFQLLLACDLSSKRFVKHLGYPSRQNGKNKLHSDCEWTRNDTATKRQVKWKSWQDDWRRRREWKETYGLPSPPAVVEFLPASQGERSIKNWVIHGVPHDAMRLWVEALEEIPTVGTIDYRLRLTQMEHFSVIGKQLVWASTMSDARTLSPVTTRDHLQLSYRSQSQVD